MPHFVGNRTKITPQVIDLARLRAALALDWRGIFDEFADFRYQYFRINWANWSNWELKEAPEENAWASIAFGKWPGIMADLDPDEQDRIWHVFLGVSEDGVNRAMRSIDNGITWEAIALTDDSTWRSICFGNYSDSPRFVAVADTAEVGSEQIVWTEDFGESWNLEVAPSTNAWSKIVFGNDTFVAAANMNAEDSIMYSTDGGETWTSIEPIADTNTYWLDVAFGNGHFVAIGYQGTDPKVAISEDGIDWDVSAAPTQVTNSWGKITYGDEIFLASFLGENGSELLFSKDNGATWTLIPYTSFPDEIGTAGYLTHCENEIFMTLPFEDSPYYVPSFIIFFEGEFLRILNGFNAGDVEAGDDDWAQLLFGNGLILSIRPSGTYQIAKTRLDLREDKETLTELT